jgi:hypothetical protein
MRTMRKLETFIQVLEVALGLLDFRGRAETYVAELAFNEQHAEVLAVESSRVVEAHATGPAFQQEQKDLADHEKRQRESDSKPFDDVQSWEGELLNQKVKQEQKDALQKVDREQKAAPDKAVDQEQKAAPDKAVDQEQKAAPDKAVDQEQKAAPDKAEPDKAENARKAMEMAIAARRAALESQELEL